MASIFDKQLLSKSDLERIDSIQSAYKQTDDEQLKKDLHERAESIRHGYGYSGGADGSEYIPYDEGLLVASASSGKYINAINAAENAKQDAFTDKIAKAEADGGDRLREAYINNMRSKLSLDQSLKANGLSGGVSETTEAGIDNNYNVLRDGIKKDTDEATRKLALEAAASQRESDVNAAKVEYDSAIDRANRVTEAEQKKYDREQDALEWSYRTERDKYQKEIDAADRAYQREQDAKEWEFRQKEFDLASKKAAQSAASASNSAYQRQVSNIMTLIKAGYYSPEFDEILGIDGLTKTGDADKDAKDAAWKLLNMGVYDDSFPELLGYSEDILQQYADNVLAGY